MGEPGRSYLRSPYVYSRVTGAPFSTNGWGLRGEDFRDGVARVVAFGGSATEAGELPWAQSWPGRLEVHLNEIPGAPDLRMTHVNLYDDTVEGLAHRSLPVFSVQYHPEAAPGPHDSRYLFDRFIDLMDRRRAAVGG